MDFQSLIRYKALHQRYGTINATLVDQAMATMDDDAKAQAKIKKLQFDVSASLYDQVEAVCQILDMSKREFLEAAVSASVANAFQIIEREQAQLGFDEGYEGETAKIQGGH